MANISAYLEKAYLDWCFGGAAVTQPATRAIGLSAGAPSSTSGSELTTGIGYARQTANWPAAASPAGSVTNNTAYTFGPFSASQVVSGLQIWDTVLTLNSGNMLWYGNLATARTPLANDTVVIAIANLTVTLS